MKSETKELIKSEFHHLDTLYFNTAYFGPSPYRAKHKVMLALQKELNPSFFEYNTWMGISDRVRYEIAQLLGCDSDHIAHQCSVSDLVSIVAQGYDYQPGDVVCSINKDYPSDVLPFMLTAQQNPNMKFELLELGKELVPTSAWLAKNLPKQTKIFCVSQVTFDTGKKVDILEIGKLMRERDILFVVDGTQAFGGMPLKKEELDYIDVYACACYKWILGPYGTAFGYFSDKALEKIRHRRASWTVSTKSKIVTNLLEYTTETLPGARKYDRGQAANMLPMACLEAGLDLLREVGLENIQEHNQKLRDYFLENYPKKKYELITPIDQMGNIVALKGIGLDPLRLERELKYSNVDVSVREGNVRLSFHLFNTYRQVDKLLRALDI